jgi:hypothetical protein
MIVSRNFSALNGSFFLISACPEQPEIELSFHFLLIVTNPAFSKPFWTYGDELNRRHIKPERFLDQL